MKKLKKVNVTKSNTIKAFDCGSSCTPYCGVAICSCLFKASYDTTGDSGYTSNYNIYLSAKK